MHQDTKMSTNKYPTMNGNTSFDLFLLEYFRLSSTSRIFSIYCFTSEEGSSWRLEWDQLG